MIGADTRLEIWDATAWETLPGRSRRTRSPTRRRRCCPESCDAAPATRDARRGLHPRWVARSADATSPAPGGSHGHRRSAHQRSRADRGPGRAGTCSGRYPVCRHARHATSTATDQHRHRAGGRRWPATRLRHVAGPDRPGARPARARAASSTGSVLVDATLGLGGHAEALLEPHPGLTLIGARPRRGRDRGSPAGGSRPSRTGSPWCTPSTTRSPTSWPARASPSVAGRPVRPRASPRCSSTTPAAASPTPRTRRWTCGWTSRGPLTAADVLNTYPAARLARVLREYGEERFARRIADGRGRGARRRSRSPRPCG